MVSYNSLTLSHFNFCLYGASEDACPIMQAYMCTGKNPCIAGSVYIENNIHTARHNRSFRLLHESMVHEDT